MTTQTLIAQPIASPASDRYAGANDALGRLAAEPSDAAAFADYVKAMIGLGLGGAGIRVINGVAASPGIGSEGQRFLDQLRAVAYQCPTGRIDWCRLADRFNGNLAAIRARWPAAAGLLAGADVSGFELYRDRCGIYHVLDLESLQWCCGLVDHRAVAASAFAGTSPINPTAAIAFDGIGLGELLYEFARRSRQTFLSYSAAISVIEPDPVALAVALHLRSWTRLLSDPRLTIFTGPDAEQSFAEFLTSDSHQPIPASVQRQPLKTRAASALPRLIESVARDRATGKELMIREINKLHPAKDPQYWARRFADAIDGHGRPLRVMGITSRFTTVLRYSMEELLGAARRAGCETNLVWEQYDHAVDYNVPARALAFRPDLIVMLSRLRCEFPDIPKHVPFLCWDQDALPVMRTPEAGASLDRLTFVAGYGAWFGMSHLGWPSSQILAEVPIAASHAYVTASPDVPIDKRFRCDIAYTSHCAETPQAMRDRLSANWTSHPVVSRIFTNVTDRLLAQSAVGHNWTPNEVYRLACEVAEECGVRLVDDIVRELCMTCMAISDRAFRHFALECVARFAEQSGRRFHLYGNGWDRHARLAPFWAGRVAFGDEFVAACRGAKLNLQLIEGGFLHSRSLDGLAAGGAFLTRATRYDVERPRLRQVAAETPGGGTASGNPGLDFWLRTIPLEPDALALLPDLPRISFSDFNSLVSIAETLIRDDALRQRIAANMRKAVLARFSYDAHWSRLIDFIRRSLDLA